MDREPIAKEVAIKGAYELSGTLTIPGKDQKQYPAILLVAGSGTIDRYGNTPQLGTEINLYRDLLQFLTSLGFVTLCYDKRGVAKSGGDYLRTGMWDLVEDLGACVQFLRTQPEVDATRILVLGHSEGSMLTTVYAARHELAGAILLAGANESLAEATARQRQLAYAELMSQPGLKGWLFRKLRVDIRGEKQAQGLLSRMVASKEDVIKVQFKPVNAKWFREHFQHDIKVDLANVTCPVLAITGSSDLQADPERLRGIKQSNIRWHIVEQMNHALREELNPSVLKAKNSFLACAKQPVHPGLKALLAEWLAQFQGSAPRAE